MKLKEPLHILILVRPFPDLRIGLRSGISLNMIIFVPEPFVFVEPPVVILYMLANRKTYPHLKKSIKHLEAKTNTAICYIWLMGHMLLMCAG